uniref:Uncharacterized protein n=1 Tax=Guillardia theta TaxID=55529 RepID=A0A7S4KRV7_GUITH|mmetsp:Transcript_29793/g.95297  ORF Transcript_29793/g.95297 Transcript_29793/m.95297 type:complete len:156 (+) Transcript_29793:104-571(+)
MAAHGSRSNLQRQLLYVAGIACTALTFCVLLIASSNLRGNRNELFQPTYFSVAPGTFLNRRIAVFPGKMLYGLGSGEEDQAANMDAVAFGSFDGVKDTEGEEVLKEVLGEDYYVPAFEEVAEAEETEKAITEVEEAILEAKQENKLLKEFAAGEA